VLDEAGDLDRLIEAADAGPAQRDIRLCNSGVMAVDGAALAGLIDRLRPGNAKGEYYLTDIVAIARGDGRRGRVVEAASDELIGVNSRTDLAAVEALLQRRLRLAAQEGGASLTDPDSVFLCADTRLGRDVSIAPNVVFGPGVTIEDGVEIKAFCHLEGVWVRRGATIGPFARLRPGSEVGEGAHVGNFVELKNARLDDHAKVNHLTYLGDARIGQRSNIGAGTITCNYDGFAKHPTEIGDDVFIGSNVALVAPVTIGDAAMIGAGSVVTRDVAPGATAIARATQVDKPGHAARFRAARRAGKV
jgi:bifunctional UDP-N-acetylglucosamine pyrophosphorylase/glucosamine-1-phosphate N-acetyltransferase